MSVLWTQGEPITVHCAADGRPLSFTWEAPGASAGARTHEVERVCNRWRVSEQWWRREDAAWREYVKVVTRDGLLCLLAKDLENGTWEIIRVYD